VDHEETMTMKLHRLAVAGVTAGALATAALTACSSDKPTELADNTRIEVTEEPSSSSVVGNDPQNITLMTGLGIIYRARIVDANGQPVSNARPTWRSTAPTVASVNALPDSVGIDGARAAIGGLSVGSALVIASYSGLADTTRVTVTARVDTVFNPPAVVGTFDATILVRGFVAGRDTANIGSMLLPGSSVTLTRLPLATGDVLRPGVTPVTTPTVFGTLIADGTSQVVFRNVPQSRFRVQVVAPSGSAYQSAEFIAPPPPGTNYGRIVTLQR
jgi:hypothetical protein